MTQKKSKILHHTAVVLILHMPYISVHVQQYFLCFNWPIITVMAGCGTVEGDEWGEFGGV